MLIHESEVIMPNIAIQAQSATDHLLAVAANDPLTSMSAGLTLGSKMISIAGNRLDAEKTRTEFETKSYQRQIDKLAESQKVEDLDKTQIHSKLKEYRQLKKDLQKDIDSEKNADEKAALIEEMEDIKASIKGLRALL